MKIENTILKELLKKPVDEILQTTWDGRWVGDTIFEYEGKFYMHGWHKPNQPDDEEIPEMPDGESTEVKEVVKTTRTITYWQPL